MKCSNCGAETQGKFCEYCGAELPRADADGVDTAGSFLGIDLGKLGASIGNALKMQDEYNKTGSISNEMQAGLRDNFGLNSVIAGVETKYRDLERSEAESKARRQKARADIAKGICPECGKAFRKRQEFCKNCGASVMTESYDD